MSILWNPSGDAPTLSPDTGADMTETEESCYREAQPVSESDSFDPQESHPGPTDEQTFPCPRPKQDAHAAESERELSHLDELYLVFEAIAVRLQMVDSEEDVKALLEEALDMLGALSPDEAANILTTYLDSGDDMPLGLPFRVGRGGDLRTPPTLRVASLDWLGRIAPERAAAYSMEVFETSEQPDEWAVAVRNYARLTPPRSDPYLDDVVREMITNPDWQARPTDGYLEAFDAAVYNEQYDLIPDLIDIADTNPDLAPVAVLAMDEMAQNDRAEALKRISDMEGGFDAMPRLRANLMARADIRDDAQKVIVADYLQRTDVGIDELKEFARLFPNHSRFVGDRLLTEQERLTIADKARIDAAALYAVEEWLADGRYGDDVEFILISMRDRLERYVGSAVKGGYLPERENN